jgi:hypothetical protein
MSTPAAKTNGLPLSYTQQWLTMYLLVAGTRPLAAQEVLGLMTPWLSGKLKISQMPAVKSVRISVVNDPDMGPVIISAPFGEGGRITQAGKLENTIVTGIKWNLRTPNYSAVTDDFLGSLRSGFKNSGRQALEQIGFKIVTTAMQVYGKSFGGQIVDYNLPETPVLPPMTVTPVPSPKPSPSPAPVPISPGTKYSLIHWAIGATALILVALATKKINGKELKQEQLSGSADEHAVERDRWLELARNVTLDSKRLDRSHFLFPHRKEQVKSIIAYAIENDRFADPPKPEKLQVAYKRYRKVFES